MPTIFLEGKKYTTKNILDCGDGSFLIPELDIIVNIFSWFTFSQEDRVFKAVRKRGEKHYQLQPIDEIPLYQPLGSQRGTYGNVVFLPIEQVAVKYFKTNSDYGLPHDMVKEIAIYAFIKRFSGLPTLLGLRCGKSLQTRYIVMPLCSEIFSYENSEFYTHLFNMVKYLRAFSEQGIIHCDIKPENCVIDRKGQIQIIDWGLAEIDRSLGQKRKKCILKQTRWYRSPEILTLSPYYSSKADIFSLGILFLQFFFDHIICKGKTDNEQCYGYIQKLLGYNLPSKEDGIDAMTRLIKNPEPMTEIIENSLRCNFTFFSHTDKLDGFFQEDDFNDLLNLISQMLEFNPENRIDYDGILGHPFFERERRKIRLPLFPVFENRMPKICIQIRDSPMRKKLFEWIGYVCLKKNFSLDSLCTAFQIYDLYMNSKGDLQENIAIRIAMHIIIASLSLGSKLFEPTDKLMSIRYQNLECRILNSEEGGDPLDLVESQILTELKGDILKPTLYSYRARKYGLVDKSIDSYVSAYLRSDIYERDFRENMDELGLE